MTTLSELTAQHEAEYHKHYSDVPIRELVDRLDAAVAREKELLRLLKACLPYVRYARDNSYLKTEIVEPAIALLKELEG